MKSTRHHVQILTLAVTMLVTGPAWADALSQIKAGKILAVSIPSGGVEGTMPGRAMGLVDAPPDLVQRILINFGQYKEFVPHVDGSRRLGEGQYLIESEFPWPVKRTWVKVQVRSGQRNGVGVVQWKMVAGTLKVYFGVAWIQSWAKDRTLLTYQMLAVPHTPAPTGLLTHGMREAATGMIDAIRDRVAQLRTAVRTPALATAPTASVASSR